MRIATATLIKLLLLVVVVAGGMWVWHTEKHRFIEKIVTGEENPKPDLARYEILIEELAKHREALAASYQQADRPAEKAVIESDARKILELVMPEMMRCWLGTAYDFNGTAEKPGQGEIACGYFVSTVIRDAGFRVNRFRLAQQPSENILRTFIKKEETTLKVGEDYDLYVDWLEKQPSGIYLMGLDTHVGFILIEPEGIRFLHSSGLGRAGVVEESKENAFVIQSSNWRLLGSFSESQQVIQTWLGGEEIRVRN